MLFHTPILGVPEIQVIDRIDRMREALRHQLPEGRRWVGLLRRIAMARAIRGSNSIEGYNVSLDDAVAAVAGEDPIDAQRDAWLAVQGYRDAMTYVLQLADDAHFIYDEMLIKGLHYMMLKDDLDKSPGRWRPGSVHVRDERTQQIVYTGPDAIDVPDLMHELMEELRGEDETPVIVKAAMAHLNFVMIHPFRDGNGRMGRCLQTLILARDGIIAPQFSSIEEYLGANTESYYQVLADVGKGSWHPEHDARPWLRFALTAQYRQAQTMVRRTEEAERRWELLSNEANRLGLPDRTVPALFNASMGFRLRSALYQEATGTNDHMAARDLRAIVAAGLLEAKGEKRGRTYLGTPRLRAMDAAIRQERIPVEDPFELRVDEPTLGL